MNNKIPLTVVMLTLNEEFHIAEAIDNVKDWAEEIFIVDSLSSDRTVDIAIEKGVKIIQRPFTNFGDQWNFALENLPIKTEWTFKMDPDERLSDELKREIQEIITSGSAQNGYEVTLRLWFMGKPLHVFLSVLRLWKTGKCKFSNVAVNEHLLLEEGKIGVLKGYMEHYDSRDLHHWIEKQNKYTSMLAVQNEDGLKLATTPNLFGNRLERRMFLINLFFKLPFRYQLQFFHGLFILGAYKDGLHGIRYVRARIMVRKWRELKQKEIKITRRLPYLPSQKEQNFDSRILESSLQKTLVK
jgi:glycosyltransferase involved in cell wall biosynthesis